MMNDRLFLFKLFLFALTGALLGASFYFEYVDGMQPCPLCLMQRLCVFILLILSIFGVLLHHKQNLTRLYAAHLLIAGAGSYFSLRQLWILSLPPDKIPACMPGLSVLIDYFPWYTVAKALFLGAGDCAEVPWYFLGISMPGWVALYFLFVSVASVFLIYNTLKNKRSWAS